MPRSCEALRLYDGLHAASLQRRQGIRAAAWANLSRGSRRSGKARQPRQGNVEGIRGELILIWFFSEAVLTSVPIPLLSRQQCTGEHQPGRAAMSEELLQVVIEIAIIVLRIVSAGLAN